MQEQQHSVNIDLDSLREEKTPLVVKKNAITPVPAAEPNITWEKIKYYLSRARDLVWVGIGGWLITGGPTFIAKFKFATLASTPEIIVNGVVMGAAAFLLMLENLYSVPRNTEFAKLQDDLSTMQGMREELGLVRLHITNNVNCLFHYNTLKQGARLQNFPKANKSRTAQYVLLLTDNNEKDTVHYTKIRNKAKEARKDIRAIPTLVDQAKKSILPQMRTYREAAERNYYLSKNSLVKYILAAIIMSLAMPAAEFGFINFSWLTPNALFSADANFITWYPFIYAMIVIGGLVAAVKGYEVIESKVSTFKNNRELLVKFDQNIEDTSTLVTECEKLLKQEHKWVHKIKPGTEHDRKASDYEPKNDLNFADWMKNRAGKHVEPEFDASGAAASAIYSQRSNRAFHADYQPNRIDHGEGDQNEGRGYQQNQRGGRGSW